MCESAEMIRDGTMVNPPGSGRALEASRLNECTFILLRERGSGQAEQVLQFSFLLHRDRVDRTADTAGKGQGRGDEKAGVASVVAAILGQCLEIEDLADGQAQIADRDTMKRCWFLAQFRRHDL